MPVADLSTHAKRIHAIDVALIRLLAKRTRVAQDVGLWKQLHNDPIFRSKVEDHRIAVVREIAAQEGLNPHFAAQLLYNIIGESCKIQMAQMQHDDQSHIMLEDPETRNAILLQNLLDLTAVVADSYGIQSGGETHPATAMYIRYEDEQIAAAIGRLKSDQGLSRTNSIALDLGCGAGRVSKRIAGEFGHVYGYDVSQYMIASGLKHNAADNITYKQHDLSDCIPHDDQSVDFVVAGLGTASDIPNGQRLMSEIRRVLKPKGRFVVSFYNREGLIYADGFVSIDPSLKAEINVDENWLVVYAPGQVDGNASDQPVHVPGKYYQIYARPYTWGEVETMVGSLGRHELKSFPVNACTIPRTTLESSDPLLRQVEKHDRTLVDVGCGAYWLVSGQREHGRYDFI